MTDNELIAKFMKRPYKAYHARFTYGGTLMSTGATFDSRDACLAFCNVINYGKEADECYFPKPVPESFADFELKYDTSWNWLMPVVQRIYELYDEFEFTTIEQENRFLNVLDMYVKYPISATYYQVVEFIKWYNQQQPNP